MTRQELLQTRIDAPDEAAAKAVKDKWDAIAKPLDGLGAFETMFARFGAVYGRTDFSLKKRAVIVMCADNGVVAEGISQSGQEVTAIVTANMGRRISTVCRMAAACGTEVIPVDIGVADGSERPGVLDLHVRRGTRDFAAEPAMTEEETLAAVGTGMELVRKCREQDYTILATGEMGIGNTTTSTAVIAALTGCSVSSIVGKGAGLSQEGIRRKQQVIETALQKYGLKNADPLRILSCVGGLDIAGLAGVFIGGAVCHIPVVIDGVISAAAALLAERLLPGTAQYAFPSHFGKEPAAGLVMRELGKQPVIEAELALGEGTGAVMLFPLLDMVMPVYENHTTFEDIHVGQYERFDTAPAARNGGTGTSPAEEKP